MISRVLLVLAGLLLPMGAVPWLFSKKTAIEEVHGLIPILIGCSFIVMAWCEAGATVKRGFAHGLLWVGVALGLLGWIMWELNQQAPEYKLNLFAFPMIPGWSLAIMGYSTLMAHRRAGRNAPSP